MVGRRPRVVNLRRTGGRVPPGAVRVDRRTVWGNPFRIGDPDPETGRPMGREDALRRFREALPKWLEERGPDGRPLRDLSELRGKDLACWCAPLPCHADILLELANGTRDGR